MKRNFYSVHGDALDKYGVNHVVTVVGELISDHQNKEIVWDADVTIDANAGKIVPGKVTFNKKVLHRKLTLGSAICSPRDKFDEETGIKIAKSRIKKGEDCGILETNSVTMLTTDCVYSLLLNKLKWICDHIDIYITESNDDGLDKEAEDTPESTESDPETLNEEEAGNYEDEKKEESTEEINEGKEENSESFFDNIPSFEELQKSFEKMSQAFNKTFNQGDIGIKASDNACKACKKKIKRDKRLEDIYNDLDDFIFGY